MLLKIIRSSVKAWKSLCLFKNNSCLPNNSSPVYTFEKPVNLCTAEGVGTLTCSSGYTTAADYLVYRGLHTQLLHISSAKSAFTCCLSLLIGVWWRLWIQAWPVFCCLSSFSVWEVVWSLTNMNWLDITLYCVHFHTGKTQLWLFIFWISCGV